MRRTQVPDAKRTLEDFTFVGMGRDPDPPPDVPVSVDHDKWFAEAIAGRREEPEREDRSARGEGDDQPLPDWQRDLLRDRLTALEGVPPEERSAPWEAIRKRLFAGKK